MHSPRYTDGWVSTDQADVAVAHPELGSGYGWTPASARATAMSIISYLRPDHRPDQRRVHRRRQPSHLPAVLERPIVAMAGEVHPRRRAPAVRGSAGVDLLPRASSPGLLDTRPSVLRRHLIQAYPDQRGEREEFVVLDPVFAQRAISGLNLITISMHHDESPAWAAQFADDVATFALRGLLSALSDLPRVRREGVEIADRLSRSSVTLATSSAT
jgi:hypothetical protein